MEVINFRALSTYLTGHPTLIRAGNIPKQYQEQVKLLEDLIGFWKHKVPPKKKK